tara:strand:- start:384 stop:587 length:204 start_codon:yes stop_codon:yes gene_type:complete
MLESRPAPKVNGSNGVTGLGELFVIDVAGFSVVIAPRATVHIHKYSFGLDAFGGAPQANKVGFVLSF